MSFAIQRQPKTGRSGRNTSRSMSMTYRLSLDDSTPSSINADKARKLKDLVILEERKWRASKLEEYLLQKVSNSVQYSIDVKSSIETPSGLQIVKKLIDEIVDNKLLIARGKKLVSPETRDILNRLERDLVSRLEKDVKMEEPQKTSYQQSEIGFDTPTKKNCHSIYSKQKIDKSQENVQQYQEIRKSKRKDGINSRIPSLNLSKSKFNKAFSASKCNISRNQTTGQNSTVGKTNQNKQNSHIDGSKGRSGVSLNTVVEHIDEDYDEQQHADDVEFDEDFLKTNLEQQKEEDPWQLMTAFQAYQEEKSKEEAKKAKRDSIINYRKDLEQQMEEAQARRKAELDEQEKDKERLNKSISAYKDDQNLLRDKLRRKMEEEKEMKLATIREKELQKECEREERRKYEDALLARCKMQIAEQERMKNKAIELQKIKQKDTLEEAKLERERKLLKERLQAEEDDRIFKEYQKKLEREEEERKERLQARLAKMKAMGDTFSQTVRSKAKEAEEARNRRIEAYAKEREIEEKTKEDKKREKLKELQKVIADSNLKMMKEHERLDCKMKEEEKAYLRKLKRDDEEEKTKQLASRLKQQRKTREYMEELQKQIKATNEARKKAETCISMHEKKVNQETLESLEKDATFYQNFLRKKMFGQTHRSSPNRTGRTELPPF